MLEPRRHPDLALEALGTKRVAQVGMKNLQGNRPVVSQVPRQVDRGHAATTQLPLDGVAVSQRCAEPFGWAAHVVAPAATSAWNRGCFRIGSKPGSICSHPRERWYGIFSSGSSRSNAFSYSPVRV